MSTTHHWSTGEVSVARDSFNCIVSRNKTDVSKIMQRSTNLGRQAVMGSVSGDRAGAGRTFASPDSMLNGARFPSDGDSPLAKQASSKALDAMRSSKSSWRGANPPVCVNGLSNSQSLGSLRRPVSEQERLFGPQRPGVGPISPSVAHPCLDLSPKSQNAKPRSKSSSSIRLVAASRSPQLTSSKCEGGMLGCLRDPFPGMEE